jgi:hypothetical protein
MLKKLPALRGLFVALALLLTLAFAAGRALASDKLFLKGGKVVEGSVVREVDGYVWFKTTVGGIDDTRVYRPDQIDRVQRDASNPAPETKPDVKPETKPEAKPDEAKPEQPVVAKAAEGKPAAAASRAGVPRIAVITLGEGHDKDMVGIFMTAEALKRAIPLLEEEHVTDVIFRINSGGGALLEIQKLSDVIQNEYKPRFRVVAWIESAISAAAMTAHCIEEVYFLEKGNYGACTGWRGALEAVKGRQLQEVLYMMEKISARGKHDAKIMRAMQIMEPLSCSIDESTGEVTWRQDLDGDYIVNPKERILTFNAQDALKYKFSRGTTNDINELAKMMGYTEFDLVGKQVPGVPYPVCRAEQLQRDFRDTAKRDQEATQTNFGEYQQAVAMARSAPKEDRGKFVGRARQALERIKRMVQNNPNFALFILNMLPEQFRDWIAEQEEMLRELMKK